jgi:hypothetical protein
MIVYKVRHRTDNTYLNSQYNCGDKLFIEANNIQYHLTWHDQKAVTHGVKTIYGYYKGRAIKALAAGRELDSKKYFEEAKEIYEHSDIVKVNLLDPMIILEITPVNNILIFDILSRDSGEF